MLDSYVMADDFEWEAPSVRQPTYCAHCDLHPKSRKDKSLCSWCLRTKRERRGKGPDGLPSAAQIAEHDAYTYRGEGYEPVREVPSSHRPWLFD